MEYYTSKKLSKRNVIKVGIYSKRKVGDVLEKYGVDALKEILKYYDVDEKILKEYHWRDAGPRKSQAPKEEIKELEKETPGTSTSTLDMDEETPDYSEDEYEGYWYMPVDWDPEVYYWDETGCYKPWIYGEYYDVKY